MAQTEVIRISAHLLEKMIKKRQKNEENEKATKNVKNTTFTI
jgi:hypothetical protein